MNLSRRLGGIGGRPLLTSVLRIVAASLVMAAGVAVVQRYVGSDEGLGAALRTGAATVAGVTFYLAGCRIFRVGELRSLRTLGRRG